MVQATNGGRRWAPRAQRAGPKPHPPGPPWHALAPADVAERFGVDPAVGLSASQVEAARKVHGLNLLPQPRPVRWPNRLLRSLRSPLILLLVVAAVLAWLSGHHTDSLAIAAVLVVNAAVGAWHEGRAERSMSALRHWDEVVVRVRRDHHDVDVPARELVPGDVVLLTAGDAVAADARLWQAARLQVSEAALTGESVPVPKDIGTVEPDTAPAGQSGMVFSGTFVTSGTATALVVATGSRSEFGRIAALAQTTRPPETPLEYRTRRFGRFLAMGAVLACAAVVFLGVLRRHPLEDISLLALGQLVSLVPEGLPVAVTIALAAGMQRMASHGALVRNLAAVETIGEATVVCTDKTGTLTRNEMTVHQAWVPSGRIFVADGTGYDPAGSVRTSDGKPAGDDPELLALAEGGLLCSDADLSSPTVPEGDWRIDGDPTEGALVVFAAKVGLDPDGHRQAHPRDAERPFDPEKQRMATRHRSPDGAVRVFVKGSPEALLLLLGDPDSPVAASARAAAETMAGDGLRVLAVGVVAGDPWAHRVSGDLLAGHVHLLGLVGQIDRPRPEVPGALRACQLAGIRVVMVTGDHLRTASAIAGEVGMLGQQDQAVDGTELSRWDDPTLDARIGSVAVFSRVSPGQKLRIVDAFQRRGELVAMTGDGVNDGPALARADVGVAMGTGGTDVARACADIVLVDNRFATLVEGIRQGRVVGENLRRVLLFVVSTSVDEVILVLLSLATGLPAPLTAVQILWVNLVTEATLTLNLVMDPPDEDVLARPPLPRNRPLVDRSMAWRIARMAASALAVCFVWFSSRILSGADLPSARAETFLLLVLCQWFHLLSAQSSTESALRIPWRTRPWLAGGLALSVLLQAGAMALEPLPKVLGTASFDPARLPWLIGAASVVLWIEEGRKAWNRRRNRPSGSPERPVSGTG